MSFAFYELNDDGEATTVHFFCSRYHAGIHYADTPETISQVRPTNDWPAQTICEYCGAPLIAAEFDPAKIRRQASEISIGGNTVRAILRDLLSSRDRNSVKYRDDIRMQLNIIEAHCLDIRIMLDAPPPTQADA